MNDNSLPARRDERLRELSLFTGSGGGVLASKFLLGHKIVGYCEWDEYCQKVLQERISDGHIDDAPIFGDIREFYKGGYAKAYAGHVDVISAGFP